MNPASFQKPSRYIGSEVNIIRKEAAIKFALCFPDTYEIGMSHLGLKILYSIINNIPDASAERVFAPWADLDDHLKKAGLPLTSLEFERPLNDFNIVGFTLQYELSYTNILNMLDLGKIPVRSEERGDDDPLVIAGGPCAVNPLPLEPFIDAFVIGDGEEVIAEIIEAYSIQADRSGRLKALSKIEGVYVPSLHDTGKERIRMRVVEDLDKTPFPVDPVVPYTSVVHDRVAIEVARGCTKGCRFCQAGMIYRPLRERSMETVLKLSMDSLAKTGHEEISFTSLNTGEYSCLLPLIRSINKACAGSNIAVSLPSLRVGSINKDVLKEIRSIRKTGFTMAPEAGTARMRDIINKDFTEEEYDETLEMLFTEGWKSIKLYFMIGLPTETNTDMDGIINMAGKASSKGRKITKRRVNINVGISAFVPKPHTPFQWLGQDSYDSLREKQAMLRSAFRKKGLNFKGQFVELSILEGVFARGGKESALLLENAWKLGCRFDSWSEMFDFSKWLEAAEISNINLYAYAARRFELDEELPWGFIDTGLNDDFMKGEFKKAFEGTVTPDCRDNCIGCGLKCKDSSQHSAFSSQPERSDKKISTNTKNLPPTKIRVRFSKTGKLRLLSHQEVMTVILRATNRARIPVLYSEGFHPHPKVSFGPALPSGVEGRGEYFDIDISTLIKAENLVGLINPELPDGLKVLSAGMLSKKSRSLNDFISRYEYEVVLDKEDEEHIHSFMNLNSVTVARKKKDVDIRPMVEIAEVNDKKLYLTLKDNGNIKVRLFEILKELLNKPHEELYSLSIRRVGLYGLEDQKWVEPLKN